MNISLNITQEQKDMDKKMSKIMADKLNSL